MREECVYVHCDYGDCVMYIVDSFILVILLL
jgi:hypothetical protein